MAITYKPSQIYAIVNSVVSQAIGGATLTATDTASLVSLGNEVLSTNTNKELFFNALCDRIGKTISDVDVYVSKKRNIYKNVIDFGNALQTITYEFGNSSIDRGWANLNSLSSSASDTGHTAGGHIAQGSPFDNEQNTTAKMYLFKDFCAWEYDDVSPDFQMRTAFTNADAMATFMGGLTIARQNKLAMDSEALGNVVIGRAMVEAYKKANASSNANGNLFINVLGYYNTKVLGLTCSASSGTITYPAGWVKASNCWENEGFVKFFSRFIKNRVSQFKDFTKLFNIEAHTTFCNNPVIEINSLIASACDYATANVFHNDVVTLPNFNAINYWQDANDGTTQYDISATTKISINDGTNNYAINNVAGIIYDEKGIMMTVENYRSHSLYNPKDEVMNTYDKANMKWAIVPYRNITVLQFADPTASGSTVSYHLNGLATIS